MKSLSTRSSLAFAFAFAFACAAFTTSSLSSAHIVMTKPPPRDDQPHKNGPCGGLPMGNTPTVFKAGQQIDITWDETIDHTGCFVLEVSMTGDDQNFQELETVQDPANAPKGYTQKVTLPNATCAKCTFRVRQLMGADPATCGPATVPTDGTYFACADIRIDPATGSGTNAGTVGGGTDAGPVTTGIDAGTGTGAGSGTGSGSGSGSGTGGGAGGGAKVDGGAGPTSSALPAQTEFADTGCGVGSATFGSSNTRAPLATFGSLALVASSVLIRRRRRQSR